MLTIKLRNMTMNLRASQILGIYYQRNEDNPTLDKILLVPAIANRQTKMIDDLDLPEM